MEIRLATVEDVDELYALNVLFEKNASREWMAEVLAAGGDEIVCIALVEGKGLGFCSGSIVRPFCYKAPRVDVDALYVKQAYRHRGTGRALLKCLEREALRRGVRHVLINISKHNVISQALYAKAGYTADGEILLKKTLTFQ